MEASAVFFWEGESLHFAHSCDWKIILLLVVTHGRSTFANRDVPLLHRHHLHPPFYFLVGETEDLML